MSVLLHILLAIICVNYCSSVNYEECESVTSCGQCIQKRNCVWCYQLNVNSETAHCINRKQKKSCSGQILIDPKANINIIENNGGHIRPQRVSIDIRKGVPFELKFTYARPKNYPVDLYFLMDFSNSMREHRDTLSRVGIKILERMNNITSEIRLGFGSFVDKVILPFVNTDKLDDPCSNTSANYTCGPPYSFKNHLSLADNDKDFSEQVSNPKLSGNLDHPEGGLDALMQAMVCQKEIGWRAKARRMIVFSTDDIYHIAGDGKLAGIVEPNDCKCHMENNQYTHSLLQDYPSIGQINAKAREHNIIIVFAVTDNMHQVYKELQSRIKNAKIGILSKNSDNIIDLLEEIYMNITDSVIISHNFDSKYFDVKIDSNCTKAEGSKDCINIKNNDIIEFTAKINLTNCPNEQERMTFQIKPSGLVDNLTVDVNLLCSCPCEHSGDPGFTAKSPECSGHGNMECGICRCEPGQIGDTCECSENSGESSGDQSMKCLNKSTGEICSGAGVCICGQCDCERRADPDEIISGTQCQCDNFSCPRRNGELCSGNGRCECKKCECNSGWTGDACDCEDNVNACTANGTVCSERGDCQCGECICKDSNYVGKYCEECKSCIECASLKACVECKAYNQGTFNESECEKNCEMDVYFDEFQDGLNQCSYTDDYGCTFDIQYTAEPYEDQVRYNIIAPKSRSCPLTANINGLISGIISSIILAGLLALLIWKGVTMMRDRKEFAKFENEQGKTKWATTDNPMFVEATTTFQNPMFGTN